jgi:hypothetical protein
MNPAALRTNVGSVREGGIVIVNEDAFGANDLKKAGYATNPVEDNTLAHFRLIKVPINKMTEGRREGHRARREGHRSLQEHVRARARLLALRSAARSDAALHLAEVRQEADGDERESARAQRRLSLR